MIFLLAYWILLLDLLPIVKGVAPTIDLSHNMRILKLPQDTKIGSVIYRLRGSDPDSDELSFGVRSEIGRQLLDFQSVSGKRANVLLRSKPTESEYKLTIYVTDGTQTTEVESSIIITNATNQKSPFLEIKTLISISELTPENEVIGTAIVRKRNSSSIPVLFELRGSNKFSIKYVISPLKESSKAEITLVQKVDYEKQNLFNLTIFALNSWTDEDVDTRNVAFAEIYVAVEDAQDTPPIFNPLPPVIKVSDSLNQGDVIVKVTAEDGDYGNQRNITYSFIPGTPGLTFFNIHSRTGAISLASSIESLRVFYSVSGPFILIVKATEVVTESNPEPPMSSETNIAFVLVNTENRPPRFLSNRYVGTVAENSPPLTSITWEGGAAPRVVDDDQGKNGSFEIFLEGDNGIFSVQPTKAMNELNFAVLVKNSEGLDYETSDTKYVEFTIKAMETASSRPLSAVAEIRIKIADANDNIPKFSEEVYNVTIPEDASPGTKLVKIEAADEDTGDYGVVRYTAVNGPIAGNLRLDPVSGELTLISAGGLDRERIPEYTLTVEARDDAGKGNRNAAEVRVSLADANDNAPVFLQPRYDGVLNPDMKSFYERLQVQAYDADSTGPNSNITYEIVNGNYQEKFLIDPFSGEITLAEALVPSKDPQDHGLPVITLTVRAHDQGVPVRYSTVKVQVHNQEYLNRSISFVVPLSARAASLRKQDLERGLSSLTGAHVNIHSVVLHNISNEKSIVRCWVSYPLTSTVDLSNMDIIISTIFGRDYYLSATKVEAVQRNSFDVVFWLLIALVILMILAIIALLFYCCCVRVPESVTREKWELKNKIAPEENIISYKEDGAANGDKEARRRSQSLRRETWSGTQRPSRIVKRSLSATEGDMRLKRPQEAEAHVTPANPRPEPVSYDREDTVTRVMYPGNRMDHAYRQGRPLSPNTEMMLQDMGQEGVSARRVGNYMVVRKIIQPTVRVGGTDDDNKNADALDEGPRRTEILYIRSPLREEDDERQYAALERHRLGNTDQGRSVSETMLNGEDSSPTTLRVPKAFRPRLSDFRGDTVERQEGPNQQLKFSRYHRTDSDVYLLSDAPDTVGPNDGGRTMQNQEAPQGNWVPVNIQSDYPRERAGPHQQWQERWEGDGYYRRIPNTRLQIQDGAGYRDAIDQGITRNEIPRHIQERSDDPGVYSQTRPPHFTQQRLQLPPREYQQTQQQVYQQHFQDMQPVPGPSYHQTLPVTQPVHQGIQDSQRILQQPQNLAGQIPQFPGPSNFPETQQSQIAQNPQNALASHSFQESTLDASHPVQIKGSEVSQKGEPVYTNTMQIHPTQIPPKEQVELQIRMQEQQTSTGELQYLSQQESAAVQETFEHQQLQQPIDSEPLQQEESIEHGDPDQEQDSYQENIESPDAERAKDLDHVSNEIDERQEGGSDLVDPKLLRPSTEEDTTTQNLATDLDGEDSDSGIGKDGTGLRLKKANLLEKKSLFTIAYDGMQTRGLKSAGDRDDSP